jgi:hypothetical protein
MGQNYGVFLQHLRITDPREFGDLPEPIKLFWKTWWNKKNE